MLSTMSFGSEDDSAIHHSFCGRDIFNRGIDLLAH